MMKIKQDNYMTDCTDAVYVENDIELLWSIRLGIVCDETKEDNDVTVITSAVYAEHDTELSW